MPEGKNAESSSLVVLRLLASGCSSRGRPRDGLTYDALFGSPQICLRRQGGRRFIFSGAVVSLCFPPAQQKSANGGQQEQCERCRRDKPANHDGGERSLNLGSG